MWSPRAEGRELEHAHVKVGGSVRGHWLAASQRADYARLLLYVDKVHCFASHGRCWPYAKTLYM